MSEAIIKPSPTQLADLYAEHGTIAAVATALGIGDARAYRWLRAADVQMRQPGGRTHRPRLAAGQLVPPKGRRAPDPLVGSTPTGREVEILAVVADGMSNAEIAARLGVTADTVKTHLRRVMARLDARDCTHAVVIALSRGLLTLSPAKVPRRGALAAQTGLVVSRIAKASDPPPNGHHAGHTEHTGGQG